MAKLMKYDHLLINNSTKIFNNSRFERKKGAYRSFLK